MKNICTVTTNNGVEFLIDKEDFPLVANHKWHIQSGGNYVRSNYAHGKSVYLHRLLLQPESGMHIDHINGNKLDNRRKNLRVCTQSQNNLNVRKRDNSASIYKGVYRSNGRINKWKAQIALKGKFYHCGVFSNEIEAALAYNAKAQELFGEYARLNIIEDIAL